ncbi:uncharacterized protein [Primulina eburnea]|uniref:uncharacterized protein n=1 Tax=Primulina eburnea TaxID=1245227 RepID=UPI003C6CB106
MSENSKFPAKKSSPTNLAPFFVNDIPLDSSLHGESVVQISCQSESICPSDFSSKRPPALFTQEPSAVSSIPASCGVVSPIPAPIWNAHPIASPMEQGLSSNSSPFDGNFRSTKLLVQTLAASNVSVDSSGVGALFSNSSSGCLPHAMGNTLVSSIAASWPPIGNAQIGESRPISSHLNDKLDLVPSESGNMVTGSGTTSPSPALGQSPAGDIRVDSAESLGRSLRVDSAVHHESSPVPVAAKASGRYVPPTISFRDILRRSIPPSTVQSFADVHDSMDEVPDPTDRDGIPGILFSDQVISSLSAPFKFALIGRISGNRGITPNKDILSAISCTGLLGSHTVRFLPRGYMVLTLSCEEDYLKFWERPEISIRTVVIRFSKWTPEFKYEADSSVVPVWVRFPDLPSTFLIKKVCTR